MMRTFPTLIKKKYYSLRNKQKTMHTAFVHMNCCLFYIFFFLFNVTLYFSLFLYVYSILYIYSFTQHNMCKRLLYCDAHAVDGGTMCFRVHNWWWSANSKMIRRWCDDCFDCESDNEWLVTSGERLDEMNIKIIRKETMQRKKDHEWECLFSSVCCYNCLMDFAVLLRINGFHLISIIRYGSITDLMWLSHNFDLLSIRDTFTLMCQWWHCMLVWNCGQKKFNVLLDWKSMICELIGHQTLVSGNSGKPLGLPAMV